MDSTQNLQHQQQALFPTAMSLFSQASLGKEREGGGQGWTEWQTQRKSVKDIKPECGRERGEEMENEGITYAGKGPLFIRLQPTAESNKP